MLNKVLFVLTAILYFVSLQANAQENKLRVPAQWNKPPNEYPYPEAAEPVQRHVPRWKVKAQKDSLRRGQNKIPSKKRIKALAKDGLFKITKKGEYLYEVKRSPQKSAVSVRFATMQAPNLIATNSAGQTASYESIYGGGNNLMIFVDYEWQFFQSFGKLGLKFGTGLSFAQGKGTFPDNKGHGLEAKEDYTLFTFPNNVALIYRAQIWDKQWFVPYAEAGADYYVFAESRDDGEALNYGAAPNLHFSGGASFLLDTLNPQSLLGMDREYGINHIWLTAEYRVIAGLDSNFDFSENIISAGILVEY